MGKSGLIHGARRCLFSTNAYRQRPKKLLWAIGVAALAVCSSSSAMADPDTATPSPLTILYRFQGSRGANFTPGPGLLVQGKDGFLYGVGYLRGPGIASAALFRWDFKGQIIALGSIPNYPTGMMQGSDGNFYVTRGRKDHDDPGSILKVTPTGVVTELHRFTGRLDLQPTYSHDGTPDSVEAPVPSEDGAAPSGSLIQDSAGTLYGVTRRGGSHGRGIAFKITSDGTYTKIADFYGDMFTGIQNPTGPLVIGKDGNLYGLARKDFSNGDNVGHGLVFRLTPSGSLSVLHAFSADEAQADSLILARDGNLYGTLALYRTYPADGTYPETYGPHLFRLSPDGAYGRFRVYRQECLSFDQGPEPFGFDAGMHIFQGPDLNFYGYSSHDILFQITPSGKETRLYKLPDRLSNYGVSGDLSGTVSIQQAPDGSIPTSLILGKDGYLYGTTMTGGSESGGGTLFRVNYAPKVVPRQNTLKTTAPKNVPSVTHSILVKRKPKTRKR